MAGSDIGCFVANPWEVVIGITAVAAALTAAASLVVSVMAYNRDRPKLNRWLEWNDISMGVYIANVGRRPIHIREVYLEDKSGQRVGIRRGVPFTVGEGDPVRCIWSSDLDEDFDAHFQPDRPLRATLKDASGKPYRTEWVRQEERE